MSPSITSRPSRISFRVAFNKSTGNSAVETALVVYAEIFAAADLFQISAPTAKPIAKVNAVIANQRRGPDNKADVTSKAAATAMQVKTTRRDLAIDLTCCRCGLRSTAGEAVANSDYSF